MTTNTATTHRARVGPRWPMNAPCPPPVPGSIGPTVRPRMTMNDTCGHCGTTYRHGDRIGCCSQCGRAFSGLRAFARHRHVTYCDDVSTDDRYYSTTDARGTLWRLVPSEAQVARLHAMRDA